MSLRSSSCSTGPGDDGARVGASATVLSRRRLVVLGRGAGAAVVLAAIGPAAVAAQTPGAYEVLSAVPQQPSDAPAGAPTYRVVVANTVEVDWSGGFATLASSPDGRRGLAPDDGIEIDVVRPDGTAVALTIYTMTREVPPIDLTPHLRPGRNRVTARLVDLEGPVCGLSRPLYLVVSAARPAYVAVLRIEPAPAGTEFGLPAVNAATSRDPVLMKTGAYTHTRWCLCTT
jgi:hypothetical protein